MSYFTTLIVAELFVIWLTSNCIAIIYFSNFDTKVNSLSFEKINTNEVYSLARDRRIK